MNIECNNCGELQITAQLDPLAVDITVCPFCQENVQVFTNDVLRTYFEMCEYINWVQDYLPVNMQKRWK